MKPFWTYVLHCANGSYYIGHTDDLDARMAQHESGAIASCYTFKRRPVLLVFTQAFETRDEALAAERQIKGWSRKKKEAMIRGDWAEVSRLARSGAGAVRGSTGSPRTGLVGAARGSTGSPRTERTDEQKPLREKGA
jgi:predicted GIY-YIG superfamily endonuclease